MWRSQKSSSSPECRRSISRDDPQASSFRAAHARCFDEADRPVVNSIIVDLMKELGHVPTEATMDDLLAAFEGMVRTWKHHLRCALHSKICGKPCLDWLVDGLDL